MQPNVSRNKHGEVNGNRGLNHKIGRQPGPGPAPNLGRSGGAGVAPTGAGFKGRNATRPNGGAGTC